MYEHTHRSCYDTEDGSAPVRECGASTAQHAACELRTATESERRLSGIDGLFDLEVLGEVKKGAHPIEPLFDFLGFSRVVCGVGEFGVVCPARGPDRGR